MAPFLLTDILHRSAHRPGPAMPLHCFFDHRPQNPSLSARALPRNKSRSRKPWPLKTKVPNNLQSSFDSRPRNPPTVRYILDYKKKDWGSRKPWPPQRVTKCAVLLWLGTIKPITDSSHTLKKSGSRKLWPHKSKVLASLILGRVTYSSKIDSLTKNRK